MLCEKCKNNDVSIDTLKKINEFLLGRNESKYICTNCIIDLLLKEIDKLNDDLYELEEWM